MNGIAIRPARPGDVRPALALAWRVFMLHSAPLYKRRAVRHFRRTCKDREAVRAYKAGKAPMFVAWDGERLVGMAAASWRRAGRISLLYVDPYYHRRGIATRLMDTLIAAMGAPKITLGSSAHGVPFYLKYGFVPTDAEQHKYGAIWTPMEYTPVAIRPARPEEIPIGLDLARRVFQEFIHPGENTAAKYDTEHETMFVALAGERVVGMTSQRGGCHIRKLYVDGAWHRRGIATKLLDAIIASMGADRVTVNSSPYAMPFYLNYGFVPAGEEIKADGFVFTPMAYEKGA